MRQTKKRRTLARANTPTGSLNVGLDIAASSVAGVPEGRPTLEVRRSRQWLDAVQAGTKYGPHVNAPTLCREDRSRH